MVWRRFCLLLVVVLAELVGLGFFIKGFFPYKKSIPGFASRHDQPQDITQIDISGIGSAAPGAFVHETAQYDRLVIMLVDALRNDFVFGNNSAMEYTQSLLRGGQAVGFTAKALAPTVTMPRIKALMTGTMPNFLDAVLNIAESDTSSSLKYHDNLLWQLKHQRNKTINMFGDDTWLRLFPGIFSKTDGTSSFFVTDTVEVDNNVTRHVRPELERNDWDVTILHYLGLDHIGHLAGPNSPLMRPKQKEMDNVVKDIYEIIRRQDIERTKNDSGAKPTLFVLLGDHAMNEIGNHGGNSKLETSTVFVFMGQGIRGQPIADEGKNALSALLAREVPQINLVPTLALLFGVPIPKNNLGVPLQELLEGYTEMERLRLLQVAADQVFGVVRANDPSVDSVDLVGISRRASSLAADSGNLDCSADNVLRCKYIVALELHRRYAMADSVSAGETERAYYDFMEQASEELSRAFSGYNLSAMAKGILVIGIATLALVALLQIRHGRRAGIFDFKTKRLVLSIPALLLLATYVMSNSSSSLIEEEHQFWYFWVQTMLALRIITSSSARDTLRTGMQMALFRIIRAWNQTGQSWAGEIDIRFYLNSSHAKHMWSLVIATAIIVNLYVHWLHLRLRRRAVLGAGMSEGNFARLSMCHMALRLLLGYASFVALVYQMERNSGWEPLGVSRNTWTLVLMCVPSSIADMARVVYICVVLIGAIGGAAAWLRAQGNKETNQLAGTQEATLDMLFGMIPLLLLLSRPHNIPLFALFSSVFSALISSHSLRPSKILVQFCLVHASFFALGNSNSLASLDLSNAYAGVSRYNEGLVGVLLFVSNWAGPLWWGAAILATAALDSSSRKEFRQLVAGLVTAAQVWQACTLLSLSVVVALMRTHLFIWSVFSPRYLYQVVWFAGYHLLYLTFGSLLWLG
ncbi:alkaline-phosphatase-like protein [Coemansia spiralis]|nr:alkaline-phosphatase-like protein [Coemansia spiralis]